VYINHNIAIPNILRIHTVLCSQYNLSSDALYKCTIYRYPIKLTYPAASYGTARYRTIADYIAIHISAMLLSVHMYFGIDTVSSVAYYISKPIVYITVHPITATI